ncbi:MAG: hypothetical protein AABY22_03140 [Nanoarchaeota archaeon]
MKRLEISPYLTCRTVERMYNPNYGDSRICICGYEYYHHFNSYDNNRNIGCKYSKCYDFIENKE